MKVTWLASVTPILLLILIAMVPLYKRYLNCSISRAAFIAILSDIAFFASMLIPILIAESASKSSTITGTIVLTQFLPRGLLYFFAIPFAVNLYDKWIKNQLTAEEKRPGMDSIRAWLGAGNLICCFGTAFCAWRGYDSPFWAVLIAMLGATLAYPVLNMLSYKGPSGQADLSKAREKILQMLEAGKITAEESAELLKALHESSESDSADSADKS
ncbi:MAG: hypothetical protein AB1656_26885 [Candidatus Omnitrophota bacterium]